MSGRPCSASFRIPRHRSEPDLLRLAFVIPWRDRGEWIWKHLPEGFTGELIFAAPEPDSARAKARTVPYLSEFISLASRRPHWDDYDVVFTWELRSALATALLRKLTNRRRARWVAIGPILKGGVLNLMPIVRFLMRDVEHIVCFSTAECDTYAELLRMPRERFSFLPTPWLSDETPADADGGYILALGHSGRDYPTLLRAVADTSLPVTIIASSPADLGGEEPTTNVNVRYNTGHAETIDSIANATFHCIPLKPTTHSAGQTVLLRAMARGKAVVVTETLGIRDYVRDGETAVLVPPGDPPALRNALDTLWNDPALRAKIGEEAARAVTDEFGFERFAESMAELASRPAGSLPK